MIMRETDNREFWRRDESRTRHFNQAIAREIEMTQIVEILQRVARERLQAIVSEIQCTQGFLRLRQVNAESAIIRREFTRRICTFRSCWKRDRDCEVPVNYARMIWYEVC